jgi:cytochrome c-type biogenesis protein CcsB
MTNETLAQYSNLSLYSAMAVLTVAMVCYAVYLAGLLPARDRAAERAGVREDALVGAGAATTDPAADVPAGTGGADDVVPLRARKAAGIAGTMTWLCGFLLVGAVAMRGLAVERWPLGNMYEFAVMGSMFTILAYAVWSTRRDLRWLGLFVTAPVLLVLGMAVTVWYTEAAQLLPSLRSYWLVIHVTVATFSVAIFTIAAAIGVVYLLRDAFQRSGRATLLDRFPAAPAIERLSYGLHVLAFPLWTFTLIAGAIWARQAWGSYWNWDPKEVWTFVIWVVYAAYLHSRATSGVSRQVATYIALAGYACIIVNYAVVNVFFVSQHSYSGL